MNPRYVCVSLGVLSTLIVTVSMSSVSVDTTIGTIEGLLDTVDIFGTSAVPVRKFLGIPYAEPPVGPLRFRKPVPKSRMDGTLSTKRHGHACLQTDFNIQPSSGVTYSEDCLFLNIYGPVVGLSIFI